jgi:hypothetical protein
MKQFNCSESPLLDIFYRPDDGLFKLKHVAYFTLCMTTWKKKYISIIRSEVYNEKSVTPRIISLLLATHYNIALAQAHSHTGPSIALFQH